MRRSASEVIRNLEMRIARLEKSAMSVQSEETDVQFAFSKHRRDQLKLEVYVVTEDRELKSLIMSAMDSDWTDKTGNWTQVNGGSRSDGVYTIHVTIIQITPQNLEEFGGKSGYIKMVKDFLTREIGGKYNFSVVRRIRHL